MLDPAPAQALDPRVLALIDILTPNQTEIAVLMGKPQQEPASAADAIEAANQLRRRGANTVVVKLGRLGAVWVSAQETIAAQGFAVDAVDSTAAGDTFNAALAVALAGERRGAIAEALQFANAAAAISVTRVGAQSSCPHRGEVVDLLAMIRKEGR